MNRDEQAPLHYNRGVLKTVNRIVLWLRRYRHPTTTATLDGVVVLASTIAILMCDRNRLTPTFAVAIICVAFGIRGLWAAAMDGVKTCLYTELSSFLMGLAVASFVVVLVDRSYPQPEIRWFAIELSSVAMSIAFFAHLYLGLLEDVAMTREDEWQDGHIWRREKVATVRRWLRQ